MSKTVEKMMDDIAFEKTLKRLAEAKKDGRKKALKEEVERIEREGASA